MLKNFWKKSVKTPLKRWLRSASCAFWTIAERPLWQPPRMLPLDALLAYAVILMALVLLLSACTTLPPKPCEKPAPVIKPALQQPIPSESYSASLALQLTAWQKKLMATSVTSKP